MHPARSGPRSVSAILRSVKPCHALLVQGHRDHHEDVPRRPTRGPRTMQRRRRTSRLEGRLFANHAPLWPIFDHSGYKLNISAVKQRHAFGTKTRSLRVYFEPVSQTRLASRFASPGPRKSACSAVGVSPTCLPSHFHLRFPVFTSSVPQVALAPLRSASLTRLGFPRDSKTLPTAQLGALDRLKSG